jgi:hypothetical protein
MLHIGETRQRESLCFTKGVRIFQKITDGFLLIFDFRGKAA